MANTIITAQGLTRRALAHLVNNLTFTRSIYTDYSNNHFGSANPKEGDSLEVRLPNYFLVKDGSVFDPQDVEDSVTQIVLNSRKHVGANFTDNDLALEIDDFAEKFLDGAIIAMKNSIDFVGLGEYKNVYNQVGTPGTTPSTLAVIGDAAEKLDDYGVPRDGNRTAIVNQRANNKLIAAMGSLYNPSSVVGRQFTTGRLQGTALDFKWEMDQNVNVHTTGNFGDTGCHVITYFPKDEYEPRLSIKGFSNDTETPAPSLKHGDVFTIENVYSVNPLNKQTTGKLQQFVVTKDAEWRPDPDDYLVSGLSPVPIADPDDPKQNVTVLPAYGDRIYFSGDANTSYPVNLLFHKNAFAFVSAPLTLPSSSTFSARESYQGIDLRIWRDSVFTDSTFPARIDMLTGFKTIRPEMAVRLIG